MRLANWPCGIREAHGAARERAEQRSSGAGGRRRKGGRRAPTCGPVVSASVGGCDAWAALLGCGAGEGVAALGELGLGGLLGGGVEGVHRAAVGSGPRGEGRLGPPGRGKGMRRRAGWVLVSSFFLLSFSISYFKPN